MWTLLKYFIHYWMDCSKILHQYSWPLEDNSLWLWWAPDFLFYSISSAIFHFHFQWNTVSLHLPQELAQFLHRNSWHPVDRFYWLWWFPNRTSTIVIGDYTVYNNGFVVQKEMCRPHDTWCRHFNVSVSLVYISNSPYNKHHSLKKLLV